MSVRAPVGPINISSEYCCIGRGLAGIRAYLNESQSFTHYYLLSMQDWLSIQGAGSTFQAIGKVFLFNLSISFPPLNEQKRIVAKLDKIIPRIDKVKERLDKISQIENNVLLSFLYSTDRQYDLKKIGSYCCNCNERYGKSIAKLRTIGVNKDKGITDLKSKAKDYSKYKVVNSGDFIYNPMRVNIGSIAIYSGNENCITSPDYVVFRTINGLSSSLLLKYLKSNQGLLEINHNTQGSVRSRLYYDNLCEIKIPIAPVEEQLKAEKILKVFSEINSRKVKVLNLLNKLSQSVLAKAFRGELVPQDPNDEPAEKLLERIMAEKAKMEAELKKAKKTAKKRISRKKKN